MTQKAMLIDITRCIGCRQCEEACKTQNNLPQKEETKLSATAYTVIDERGDRYIRRLCMHCQSPTCASVCPVGAFRKTDLGPVVYDSTKCIGCRYCMMACPFQVPRYEWDSVTPKVQKCKMCYERISAGQMPACVEICPAEVTTFGNHRDLLAEAHRRIAENPGTYIDHIFGEEEAGGTSILYLSDVSFEKLGFKTNVGRQALPELTWSALSKIPKVVLIGGTFLFGIWWITNRRKEVQELERKLREEQADSLDEEDF